MTYGAWNVTEAEYQAALADDDNPGAWQVVRYCQNKSFVADYVRHWIKNHRASAAFDTLLSPEAELRASAAFAELHKALD